ncbi:MAG: DUF1330 domain-containing protein [Ruegeria sp.]
MSVLNIALTEIHSPEKMQAYIKAAAPLMKRYGAEVVVRGDYVKTLLGDELSPHIVGIFRFPDLETAEQFYSCDEYLALISLRDAAGTMTFNFYEE